MITTEGPNWGGGISKPEWGQEKKQRQLFWRHLSISLTDLSAETAAVAIKTQESPPPPVPTVICLKYLKGFLLDCYSQLRRLTRRAVVHTGSPEHTLYMAACSFWLWWLLMFRMACAFRSRRKNRCHNNSVQIMHGHSCISPHQIIIVTMRSLERVLPSSSPAEAYSLFVFFTVNDQSEKTPWLDRSSKEVK